MATPVIMPKLEMSQETATIVEWLRKEGELIEKGEPLLVVETDKVTVEIESPASGILAGVEAVPDQVIPVTEIVAYILKPGEELPEQPPLVSHAPRAPAGAELRDEKIPGDEPDKPPVAASPQRETSQELRATPVARRIAEAHGIDLRAIAGTGPGGQIVRADVETVPFRQGVPEKPRATPAARRIAGERGINLAEVRGSGPRGRIQAADVSAAPPPRGAVAEEIAEVIPLKGVRRLTAERMLTSAQETAHVTLVTEVNATAFVKVREQFEENVAEEWGFAPGYNDLLGLIVARALREFPYMNARLSADGQAIERLSSINLGLAVDTERGLLVPVIRDADQKGLRAFGSELRELMARARAGKARPEDLAGGTFTITNLGMYEIDAFTPIIKLPEVAILGVGRIQSKPVAIEGQIVVREMWTLSLGFDHRLVDGAPASRFLQRIKKLVENPFLIFE